MLSALHILPYSILTITLLGWYFYNQNIVLEINFKGKKLHVRDPHRRVNIGKTGGKVQ